MELTYYESQSDLQHLNEALILEPFWGVRQSYDRLICASFGAGLALDFAGTIGSQEYVVLHNYWASISKGSNLSSTVLEFWLRVSILTEKAGQKICH